MKPSNFLPYKFGDATPLEFEKEGYGKSVNKMARDGIYLYMGYELGREFEQERVYRILRRREVVGDAESLASFAGKPMTIGHPYEDVDLTNWRDYAVGHIGDDAHIVEEDGVSYVEATNYLQDANAIAKVLSGEQEISMGYDCEMSFEGGSVELPNGETVQYDGEQLDIRINHAAIVPRGRAGSLVRVITDEAGKNRYQFLTIDESKRKLLTKPKKGDSGETDEDESSSNDEPISKKENPMTDKLKSFAFGDKAFNLDAADGAEIKALFDGMKDTHAQAITDLETAHETAIGVKDAELVAKDERIAELESQAVKPADLTALIAERQSVADTAKTLGVELTDADKTDVRGLKMQIIAAKMPDSAYTEDTADETVNAVYDALTATATPKTSLSGVSLGDAGNADDPVKRARDAKTARITGRKTTEKGA